MPTSVLSRRRSAVAWFAILAVVASLMALAAPASAHSVAIDTSATCPSTIPSAGFTDIGAFDAETQNAINCIAFYDVTVGTSATTYSPNLVTLRRHMALFLIRSAREMGVTIPAASNQGFQDIGNLPQEEQDAINQLAALNITRGTSSTTFSPNDDVDRWEMALFLRRLLAAAGFTFTDDATHGNFSDVGSLIQEAQDAIDDLADAHITLGTGGSLYEPFRAVDRWQMALFLTRVLAADGVRPSGLRVSVAPTDTANLSVGQSRTYTATFRNDDGTPYTGAVGIQILDTTAAGAPIFNDTSFAAGATVAITAVSDNLSIVGGVTATGTAGTDGVVTFTVRVTGAAEQVVPLAWQDLDGDGTYESIGNAAPTEPFGLGGVANFTTAAAGEATSATHTGFSVTKTTKASDTFEASLAATDCGNGAGAPCTFRYDANDVFTVDGGAANLADFESALSVGDVVTVTYDRDTADQSTFALTDNIAPLTVSNPPAAGDSVDAATYAVRGSADPGATVRIKTDLNNDGDASDPGEGTVATGTADEDGNWTVNTPLAQNVANNFVATQVPVGGVESAPVDVPTITEGPATGALVTGVSNIVDGGLAGVLDVGDRFEIDFNKTIQNPTGSWSVQLLETTGGGTQVTLTCGTNATCSRPDADTVRVTVNAAPTVTVAGDNSTINGTAIIQGLPGFTDVDGLAVNVAGSAAANRTFTGF